jgi:hypothetical protein
MNAAYFTRPGINPLEVAGKIRSVIKPGDEIGLHIHALESLLDATGVEFREGVTYWGSKKSQPFEGQRGHDVPLTLFSRDEIRKLIRKSMEILRNHGFSDIKSFRAGGWVATPEVLEAVRSEGIRIDSSAISTELISYVVRQDQPLYQINKELWPDQTPFKHRPYELQTPAGTLIEFPNNIGLADYVDAKTAFEWFEKIVEVNFSNVPSMIFHYGFHQETAGIFLPRVVEFIKKLRAFEQNYRVITTSVTFNEIPPQAWAHSPQQGKSCLFSLKKL